MILDFIRVKNFKAIRDSGLVKFGALTAFIGNNGAGKSSLIEALETYQVIVSDGLDVAMQRFMGIEHVQNKHAKPDTPIGFDLRVRGPFGKTHLSMNVASDTSRTSYAITEESVVCKAHSADGMQLLPAIKEQLFRVRWNSGFSMLGKGEDYIEYVKLVASWQFLTLTPERMGYPLPQKRTGAMCVCRRIDIARHWRQKFRYARG